MTGRYCFRRCLSVNISGGGVTSSQVWGGGVPGLGSRGVPHLRSRGDPSQVWGVPHLRSGGVPHLRSGGVPHLRSGYPPPRWISIASSCYAAGGMPLAFTQEDFLVSLYFQSLACSYIFLLLFSECHMFLHMFTPIFRVSHVPTYLTPNFRVWHVPTYFTPIQSLICSYIFSLLFYRAWDTRRCTNMRMMTVTSTLMTSS